MRAPMAFVMVLLATAVPAARLVRAESDPSPQVSIWCRSSSRSNALKSQPDRGPCGTATTTASTSVKSPMILIPSRSAWRSAWTVHGHSRDPKANPRGLPRSPPRHRNRRRERRRVLPQILQAKVPAHAGRACSQPPGFHVHGPMPQQASGSRPGGSRSPLLDTRAEGYS
eukprot:jgi/Botrbrau1/4092/Bobra.152_3s0042.2